MITLLRGTRSATLPRATAHRVGLQLMLEPRQVFAAGWDTSPSVPVLGAHSVSCYQGLYSLVKQKQGFTPKADFSKPQALSDN